MTRENITIVDGQMYRPGDKIWDLGSFVATSAKCRKRNYEGLSKDIEKLPHYVDTGSSAFCLDTGDYYKFLRSTDTWYKIGNYPCSGGNNRVADYKDLTGKPQINGVTLQGNLTLKDLGINVCNNTPIGEIISYMGKTAPDNYLICDGSEFSISQYPELTDHFMKEFGSVNYFGGDGITTFAVPDLRGEFLRGSGTGTRETGSGAEVGKHQDATLQQHIGKYYDGDINNVVIFSGLDHDTAWGLNPQNNFDTVSALTPYRSFYRQDVGGQITDEGVDRYTARPTNTAVLYCIKCRSITAANVSDTE